MPTKLVNLTPHTVRLNSGREILPTAPAARVASTYTDFDQEGVCEVRFGEVQNLPLPEEGTTFIVSALVAQAVKRRDVVSPATGHPMCIRVAEGDKKGQIISVPGFVRAV